MSLFIYNLITQAYFSGIKLAANWNEKARQWVKGREGLFEKLACEIPVKRNVEQRLAWMHCASLGEFEQGRTVIEALKKKHPDILILLSFFSPSGYEIRKNYEYADWVIYLPADSKSNAKQFLDLVKPDLAIFVKYEFWYHFLYQLNHRKIKSLLISALFRPSQPFFQWYGSLHRSMLFNFTEVFVQDSGSKNLLEKIGMTNVTVAGDSRVDRVLEIAKTPKELPLVKAFCGDAPVLVCGSTWPADEAILFPIFERQIFENWKIILAPHDVQLAHIQEIEKRLGGACCRLSELDRCNPTAYKILLVDNVGLLSSLYCFGRIAYIGGGFGKGIHNVLEPAAYGLPVVFGPRYEKFEEARWLVNHRSSFVVRDEYELNKIFVHLRNPKKYSNASNASNSFINMKTGATNVTVLSVISLLYG